MSKSEPIVLSDDPEGDPVEWAWIEATNLDEPEARELAGAHREGEKVWLKPDAFAEQWPTADADDPEAITFWKFDLTSQEAVDV